MKVSIIVPIYNSSKYLKKCLDSLVSEEDKDMEFILINDGSTDSSEDIINLYHDSRIRYFKQDNRGIGATRNRGIKLARGEYIGFLDSDDYIEKNMYSMMYNHAKKNELDIVICDFYEIKNNNLNKVKLIDFPNTNLNNYPNLLMDIQLGPCNKIYKGELLDSNSYFPENLKYEDTPFTAYMLSKGKCIGKLNKYLYYYVIHGDSETTTVDKRVFDIFEICDILRSNLGNNKYIESSLNDLIIYLITKYTISMRYVKNKKLRNDFINQAFDYLNNNIKDYKKSNYMKNRNILKRVIEENIYLTKIYCNLYTMLKNVK